jgi:hypothetical protein
MTMAAGVPAFVPVPIPSNQTFLTQWHPWIHGKVSRHFKRDKERIPDTAQNVRLRLISKDFIGRWFFKHLREELLDRTQAEHVLGGAQLTFIGSVLPVDLQNSACLRRRLEATSLSSEEIDDVVAFAGSNATLRGSPHVHRIGQAELDKILKSQCVKSFVRGHGCVRSCPSSLWRVSDLLAFARFDYERYYYSIQGHTLDSDKILRLLGCAPGRYSVLQSMQRQGRLLPSELTDHDCARKGQVGAPPSSCVGCEHGIALLRARGLSLADDWMSGPGLAAAAKLRWNDSQLSGMLRDWKKANAVFAAPQYIMRTSLKPGVTAGLLKYAEMVIDHEVCNDFKRMRSSDDLSCTVFNKSASPEYSDSESVAWDGGGEGEEPSTRVIRDVRSLARFSDFEDAHDLARMLESANLTEEEMDALKSVDLGPLTVRQYSDRTGKAVPRVHRIRSSAMRKIRESELGVEDPDPDFPG